MLAAEPILQPHGCPLKPMASRLSVEQRHPELFTFDKNIDRQHGVRTVPMEVMNLGFPRTGTMCTYPTPVSFKTFHHPCSNLFALTSLLS